jgi:hypothetical protein
MRGRMKQSFRFRKDSGLPITESAFSDRGSLTWSALQGKSRIVEMHMPSRRFDIDIWVVSRVCYRPIADVRLRT